MKEEGLKEVILVHIPGVPEVVTMSWIVMAVIILLSFLARKNMKNKPEGLQNTLEYVIEWIQKKIEELMGKNGVKYMPLFITLFLFIFFSNLLGLIPGFKSPTSSLSVTFSLALIVFVSTQYFGIKQKGLIGYLKHFMGPVDSLPLLLKIPLIPLFIIIHVIGEFVKPMSLTLRLFFNILAKELVLTLLAGLILVFYSLSMPKVIQILLIGGDFALRPFIIWLGFLVSFVQALVFTSLAMIYIGTAVQEHDHK